MASIRSEDSLKTHQSLESDIFLRSEKMRQTYHSVPFPNSLKWLLGLDFILFQLAQSSFGICYRDMDIRYSGFSIEHRVPIETLYCIPFMSMFLGFAIDSFFDSLQVLSLLLIFIPIGPMAVILFSYKRVVSSTTLFDVIMYMAVVGKVTLALIVPVKVAIMLQQIRLPKGVVNVRLTCTLIYLNYYAAKIVGYLLHLVTQSMFKGPNHNFFKGCLQVVLFICYTVCFFMLKKHLISNEPSFSNVKNVFYTSGKYIRRKSSVFISWTAQQLGKQSFDDKKLKTMNKTEDASRRFVQFLLIFCSLCYAELCGLIMDYIWEMHIYFLTGGNWFYERPVLFKIDVFTGICAVLFHIMVFRCLKRTKRGLIWNTDLRLIGFKLIVLIILLVVTMLCKRVQETEVKCPRPVMGLAQLRIYNCLSTPTIIKSKWTNITIKPFGLHYMKYIQVVKSEVIKVKVINKASNINYFRYLYIQEREAVSYIIVEKGMFRVEGYDPTAIATRESFQELDSYVYVINAFTDEKVGYINFVSKNTKHFKRISIEGLAKKNAVVLKPNQNYTVSFRSESNKELKALELAQLKQSYWYSLVIFKVPPNIFEYKIFEIMDVAHQPRWIEFVYMILRSLSRVVEDVVFTHFIYTQNSHVVLYISVSMYMTVRFVASYFFQFSWVVLKAYFEMKTLCLVLVFSFTNFIFFNYLAIRYVYWKTM